MNAHTHRDWVLEALEQHEVALTHYALRLLGDLERARDVVQHAYLRLCEQSPEKIRAGVRQWLYTVCRNRAFDLLRKTGRETEVEKTEDDEGWRDAAGREPDPAEAAEAEELCELLRCLVRRLPVRQQEAIDLWCDGFSHREIATIIGRQEGTVRVLVHRGLTTLREQPQVRAWLKQDSRSAPIRVANAGRP